MTINEFLECFNGTLKQKRLEMGLENSGHLVFYQCYDKKIGNYYDYHLNIEYVCAGKTSKRFVSYSRTVQVKGGQEGREKEEKALHKAIVSLFLTKMLQPGIYESLTDGSYGTE